MTNMRERIARNMCGPSWDAKNFNETPDGSSPEENREYYFHMADLALGSLLFPTEQMLAAADSYCVGCCNMTPEQIDEVFTDIIQAARDGL